MKRTIGCLAAAAILGAAAGCSSDHKANAASPKTRVGVCNTVNYAYTKLLKPNHLTFAQLVDQTSPTKISTAAVGVMSLSMQGDAVKNLGPYQPAILYLQNRNMHWHKEFATEYPMPKRTHEVTAAAKRLDRDIASLCKPEKVVKPTTTR